MHDVTQIYCLVRKKWITRTPEEEVRQALIKHLNLTCHAPLSLMTCEYPLLYNGRAFRADLVLHDRQAKPMLLAEFKAPDVPIGPQALDQLQRYNTVLRTPFLLLSNSIDTYCCQWDASQGSYTFLSDIPPYESMIAHPTTV